jgi:hypothetical protein
MAGESEIMMNYRLHIEIVLKKGKAFPLQAYGAQRVLGG